MRSLAAAGSIANGEIAVNLERGVSMKCERRTG
jgi:hypothetical protein